MNERILELAEQAGFYVSANGTEILIPDPHTEDITEVTKKFAELIVVECKLAINQIDADDASMAVGLYRAEVAIENLFGVKK